MNNSTREAYGDICLILDNCDQKLVERIPLKLKKMFYDNRANDYNSPIDLNVPLNEQDLSSKTRGYLAMLYLNYWCETQEEKLEFQNKLMENEKKYQEELRNKYNPDNIFDRKKDDAAINKNTISESETEEKIIDNNTENLQNDINMVQYSKWNDIKNKIINFIKSIFRRN